MSWVRFPSPAPITFSNPTPLRGGVFAAWRTIGSSGTRLFGVGRRHPIWWARIADRTEAEGGASDWAEERMNAEAERSGSEPSPSRLGRALIGAAVACVVAAGILLWSRHGDAVFSDMVLTAVAWCF